MNVVFLSPHFPPNWFRFVVGLRNAGATTLGIADAPWDSLRPELREALDEFYRVDDLGDHDQLARALGWFIHRRGLIDRSWQELWIDRRPDQQLQQIHILGEGRLLLGEIGLRRG